MVREYSSSPATMRPHPVIQSDVMDEDGNLRAADIGITWAGNETFLHGIRVVGPGPTRPAGMGPVMSTPYQPTRPGVFVHNGTTTDTVVTINSSGRGDPAKPSPTRDTSGVSTGCPHLTLQQQVPELAGVVQAFPGGG